jgi:hypothetical protein
MLEYRKRLRTERQNVGAMMQAPIPAVEPEWTKRDVRHTAAGAEALEPQLNRSVRTAARYAGYFRSDSIERQITPRERGRTWKQDSMPVDVDF